MRRDRLGNRWSALLGCGAWFAGWALASGCGSGSQGEGAAPGGSSDASADAWVDADSDAPSQADDATDEAADAPTEGAPLDGGGDAPGDADAQLDAQSDATASDGAMESSAPDLCAGVVCTAMDACHVAGTCDPNTGMCSNPTAPDGTACTCGTCTAGACSAVVVGATNYPVSLAADSTRAYVGNSGNGVAQAAGVGAVPVSGGTATALASGLTGYPNVTVAGGTVYFTSGGVVSSVPADGSAPPKAIYTATAGTFASITTDGVQLYLTIGNQVTSLPFTGGTLNTLATTENTAQAIVTDGARLYWIDEGTYLIRTMTIAGGSPITIASESTPPGRLAVDSSHVYWTQPNDGDVWAAPIAAGAQATLLAQGQAQPDGITVFNGALYWTNYDGGNLGTIMWLPVGGGAPRAVPVAAGTNVTGPFLLAHNAQCLFGLDSGKGALLSIPPQQ